MKEQYIWRVENEKGVGCYRQASICPIRSVIMETHNRDGLHPMPEQDSGIARYMDIEEICGFRDLQQLKEWFTREELIALAKLGYKPKRIKVNRITKYGDKQVLAKR